MAKKSNTSAFDELLETFSTDDDRRMFSELSERNPKVREYGLRQSDYSRLMNENGENLRELDDWRAWRATNWVDDPNDPNRGYTKRELAQIDELRRLEQEKTDWEQRAFSGGEEVDFAQLESWGKEWIDKNGVVTKDTITKKEQEFRDYVNNSQKAYASAAVLVPYLNQKHDKEFGELFEPDEFLKQATEKGRWDLKDFYEKDFVVEKRAARERAQHEAEIKRLQDEKTAEVEKARKEADDRLQRMQGMGPAGMSPADGEGPQMGAFQRQYLKLDKQDDNAPKPPDVALGEGGIAAFAAREFRQNLANR